MPLAVTAPCRIVDKDPEYVDADDGRIEARALNAKARCILMMEETKNLLGIHANVERSQRFKVPQEEGKLGSTLDEISTLGKFGKLCFKVIPLRALESGVP